MELTYVTLGCVAARRKRGQSGANDSNQQPWRPDREHKYGPIILFKFSTKSNTQPQQY